MTRRVPFWHHYCLGELIVFGEEAPQLEVCPKLFWYRRVDQVQISFHMCGSPHSRYDIYDGRMTQGKGESSFGETHAVFTNHSGKLPTFLEDRLRNRTILVLRVCWRFVASEQTRVEDAHGHYTNTVVVASSH